MLEQRTNTAKNVVRRIRSWTGLGAVSLKAFLLIVVASVVAGVLFIMSASGWATSLWPPHSSWLDFLYTWFDPFLLYLISGWFILFLLFLPMGVLTMHLWKRTDDVRANLAAAFRALVALMLLTPLLYGLSEVVLKRGFRRARPLCQTEHSIIAAALDGELTPDQYSSISGGMFQCPVGRIVFGEQARGGKQTFTDEFALREMVRNGWSEARTQHHLYVIRNKIGIGPYDVGLTEKLKTLQEAAPWREKGIKPFFTFLLFDDRDDCEQFDSCPSGHVMRQAVILFLAFAFAMWQYTKIPTFRRKPRLRWVLLGLYVLIFLWCAWSRVYGYRHNWSDVMLSTVFSFVLITVAVISVELRFVAERTFGRNMITRVAGSDLIRGARVMIVFFDMHDSFLVWNHACEQMTGYSEEDIKTLDDYISKLYPDADIDTMKARLRRAVKSGKSDINVVTLITAADKEKKLILWNATPIHDSSSRVIGKLSVGIPISWRDRRFTELGFISANLLHDIRRNLGNIQLLLEDRVAPYCQGDERAKDACQRIKEMTSAIQSTAEDYRSYAMGDVASRGRVKLQDVITFVYNSVLPVAAEIGIQIRIESDGSSPTIVGHEGALRRVFFNLLRNSIVAIQDRLESDMNCPKEIVVSVGSMQIEGGQFVTVEVADTGTGLGSSIQRVIDSGPVWGEFGDSDLGIGLGLITVRVVVMDHGGVLYSRPRDTTGTVVGIRFPVWDERIL